MAISTAALHGKLPVEATLSAVLLRQSSFGKPAILPWPSNRSRLENPMKVPAMRVRKSGHNFVCSGEVLNSHVAKDQDNNEVMVLARQAFREEVSFRKVDDAVSLAKGALLISAEDQAFISLNKEKDTLAFRNEISNSFSPSTSTKVRQNVDASVVTLGALSVAGWMEKVDALLIEVEAQLSDDEGRRRPLQIMKAVNTVLFKTRGLNRTHSSSDPFRSYIDHVLTLGSGTGVLLGVIYLEVCRRLGMKMEGAAVRESFLVWPLLDDSAQMVFEPCKSGKSWMFDKSEQQPPQTSSYRDFSSDGSMLHLSVVKTLEPISNRDILGVILRNLKKAYWKRAAKARPGLTPAAALQPFVSGHNSALSITDLPVGALLRQEDLRLAVMASERLLLLEPRNWALRKEHGLLLYHSRRYGEAVQELSICMALAPMREEELLQPFVERLHLMRLESTWGTFSTPSTPSALV